MPTLVYSYGAKPPRNLELVERQMSLAHRYYNGLVEIERGRFDDTEECRRRHSADLRRWDEAVDTANGHLLAAIKTVNEHKAQRLKGEQAKAAKDYVKTCRQSLREAYAGQRAAKEELKDNPDYLADLKMIRDRASEERKMLYNDTPELFWGTKNAQVAAVEQAAAKTLGPVRFRRWSRDSRLTAQVMGGATADQIFGCTDTRIQIERLPGKRKQAVARLRVGSSPESNRVPLWAEMLVYVHRPLPLGSKVVSAQIVRRERTLHRMNDGHYRPRDEWSLQLTVVTPESPHDESDGGGAAAIDTGWRRRNSGIRVAYLVDENGHEESLSLPNELLDRWTKCRDLQSIRDLLFNETRDALDQWLKSSAIAPDWLRERCQTLHQWRSIRRLLAVLNVWDRFDGDTEIHERLCHWRDREAHLHQYQVGNLATAEATRLDLYRNFAVRVATNYRRVALKDQDFAQMRRDPNPEDQPTEISIHWRNAAANGLLVNCIQQACANRGVEVVKVAPQFTTMTCHACRSVQEPDGSTDSHYCTNCDAFWDLDANACRNLLSSHRTSERPSDDETPAPDRDTQSDTTKGDPTTDTTKGGKWGRRKANRSQRKKENVAN